MKEKNRKIDTTEKRMFDRQSRALSDSLIWFVFAFRSSLDL